MKKNDDIILTISGMTAEGNGVGRYEGMAVFVPEVVVGERVSAHIIKVQKNYAVARLNEVIEKSGDRCESDCPVSHSCGGCAYRHINYSAECEIKYNRVKDAFSRIGGIDVNLSPIISAVSTSEYRNKAQYPISENEKGEPVIGFYANRTHRVINNSDCLLQPAVFGEIAKAVKSWIKENKISIYNENLHKGILRHLYIRRAEATGEIMVCLVVNADILPRSDLLIEKLNALNENIVSIQYNINKNKTNVVLGKESKVIFGKEYIEDILCGKRLRLSAHSFYQVNRKMAEILYNKAREYAEPCGKTVLDLYCGIGSIGLSVASDAKKLIGVEIVPEAIEDAKYNAIINGVNDAEFIVGDAYKAAKELAERKIKADVIILDPPRKGCDAELIRIVAEKFSPERVVYVSCDPATLARDTKLFGEYGYLVTSATPVDLFPRTTHVECVVLMSRRND